MVQQVFLDPPEISLFPLKDTEMLISLVRHHLTGKLAEEEFYLRVGLIFFFFRKKQSNINPRLTWDTLDAREGQRQELLGSPPAPLCFILIFPPHTLHCCSARAS